MEGDDQVKISVEWEVTKSWLALIFGEILKKMSLDKTAKFQFIRVNWCPDIL